MTDLSVPHNMIAHLPSNGLIGITWGGASLAIVFICARLVVRVKYMKRLLADDYFMLFALVLLVANAILHTLQTPHLYYLGLHPTGAEIEYHVLHYLCYEFAISGIFWTILWSVKGSFLALFWMVSDGLPVYRRAWWAVVVFACLAYLGCWVVLVYTCHPPSSYFKYGPGMTLLSNTSNFILMLARSMWKANRFQRVYHCHLIQHICGHSNRPFRY